MPSLACNDAGGTPSAVPTYAFAVLDELASDDQTIPFAVGADLRDFGQ